MSLRMIYTDRLAMALGGAVVGLGLGVTSLAAGFGDDSGEVIVAAAPAEAATAADGADAPTIVAEATAEAGETAAVALETETNTEADDAQGVLARQGQNDPDKKSENDPDKKSENDPDDESDARTPTDPPVDPSGDPYGIPCAEARNHGEYVSSVAKDPRLEGVDKTEIMSQAAQTDCGKSMKADKADKAEGDADKADKDQNGDGPGNNGRGNAYGHDKNGKSAD